MKERPPSLLVSVGDLRPALAALGTIVPTKKKSGSPALQCVKVETLNRKLIELSASDGDTFLSLQVPASAESSRQPFLVPLSRLREQIRGARIQESIAIRPGKVPPVSEFPATPKFRATAIELEAPVVQAIRKAFACSSHDPTRYVLHGACLDVSGNDGPSVVATDGRHLLAANSLRIPQLKETVILPAHKVHDSHWLNQSAAWQLRVSAPVGESQQRYYRIDGPSWCLTGKMIDGNFPNYRQVIPAASSFKTRLTLPTKILEPLAKAIRRMPGGKANNRPVGLRIDSQSFGVIARGEDEVDYEEIRIPVAEIKGKPITVFLNRDYLVKALSFGMNCIEVIDEASPVKCTSKTEFMIVMPVRQAGEVRVGRSTQLASAPVKDGAGSRQEKVPVSKPVSKAVNNAAPKPELPSNPTKKEKAPTMNKNGSNPPPAEDPIETAARHLNETKEALKAATTALGKVTSSLKTSRQQQRQTDREIRTVRQTIRSLRKVEI